VGERRVKEDKMVYPKRVVWNGTSSGHRPTSGPRSQRELVEASLRLTGRPEERWDERTRTVVRTARAA
jgi:hypothetical protein